MNNNLAIYDTGVGGLSIMQELLKYLPSINIIYFDDSGFFPMGNKSFIEIQERLKQVCQYLFNNYGVNLIVLGCNTATVTSIRELQLRWLATEFPSQGKNIIGISTPITEQIIEKYWHLRDEPGMIISTSATFRTGFYQAEFLKYGFRNFLAVPSTNLATGVQLRDPLKIQQAIDETFEPFLNNLSNIRILILACTHYHWVESLIKSKFSLETKIINPGEVVARKLIEYIDRHPEYKIDFQSKLQLLTTGIPEVVKTTNEYFLHKEMIVYKVDNTIFSV